MSIDAAPADLAALREAARAADPAALVVPRALIRRVVKRHCGAAGFGPRVPHQDCYTLAAQDLLALVGRKVLAARTEDLPSTVILIAEPELGASRSAALRIVWRRLFHARVHLALQGKHLGNRLARLGETVVDEARAVLREERLLLPPANDDEVYAEFAATYLELRHFEPERLPITFPSLPDPATVDALLAEDLEVENLLRQTRPSGVAEREIVTEINHRPPLGAASRLEGEAARAVRDEADAAAARGNLVRAALQASRVTGGEPAARGALDLLVSRLQKAAELSDEQADALRGMLPALLPSAARGMWTVEARLLFDLQNVCVDHERGVFGSNVLGWLLTLGRRPLRRPQPCERQALVLRNLRKAAAKSLRTALPPTEQAALVDLLDGAAGQYAARLRERFRPLVAGALDQVGLVPRNLPERVARDRVVEELLDRVTDRCLLTLSDVRDALARNQLKLDDLAGPGEWVTGDALLRLNARLSEVLDGVYRKGEVYLRGLQRASSLAFGTRPGRFLTRYLALPFGGGVVAVVVVEELLHVARLHAEVMTLWNFLAAGLFLFLLMHVPPFRRGVVAGLRGAGKALRAAFIDGPVWLVRRPAVRAVLESAPVRFFARRLLLPLILAAAGALIAWGCGAGPPEGGLVAGCVFVVAVVFFNMPLGRDVVEAVADRLTSVWERVTGDFFPALIRAILAFFKAVVDRVERVLYSVDERLRFRSGDSTLSLAMKSVAGSVWAVFAYLVRFVLIVLFEPQVNPVKHFPTVTVGHKLLMMLAAPVSEQANIPLATVALVFSLIPGLFGFLVWELKENWKLYAANRPAELRAVVVGGHGETVLRLLRPGFHSGTLPKIYRKARRAARRHDHAALHKQHLELHHVEEAVRHLVRRELVRLLALSRAWDGRPLAVGAVSLASNRIQVELLGVPGEAPSWVTFDLRAGRLVAGFDRPGWVAELSGPRRDAFLFATIGLYKLAGADSTPSGAAMGEVRVLWTTWVAEWERDQAGKAPRPEVLGVGEGLLPEGPPAERLRETG